jgi:hypothetical protein
MRVPWMKVTLVCIETFAHPHGKTIDHDSIIQELRFMNINLRLKVAAQMTRRA